MKCYSHEGEVFAVPKEFQVVSAVAGVRSAILVKRSDVAPTPGAALATKGAADTPADTAAVAARPQHRTGEVLIISKSALSLRPPGEDAAAVCPEPSRTNGESGRPSSSAGATNATGARTEEDEPRRFLSLHALLRQAGGHPGILPCHAYCCQDTPGYVYTVCASMPSTLQAALTACNVARPMSTQAVLAIVREIATALAFLHASDICLCGLAPEMVGLDPSLQTQASVRITSLASCHVTGESLSSSTLRRLSNPRVLAYVAPEIAWGATTTADPAVDVWSLGCLLAALAHGSGCPIFAASSAYEHAAAVTDLLGYDAQIGTVTCFSTPAGQLAAASYKSRFLGKRGVPFACRLPLADNVILMLVSRCLTLDPSKRISAAEFARALGAGAPPSTVLPVAAAAGLTTSGGAAAASERNVVPASTSSASLPGLPHSWTSSAASDTLLRAFVLQW
mgnify:CR=1 FL=1